MVRHNFTAITDIQISQRTTKPTRNPRKAMSHLRGLPYKLFCSIQEIDGLVCKKNGQSRKFGILAGKI